MLLRLLWKFLSFLGLQNTIECSLKNNNVQRSSSIFSWIWSKSRPVRINKPFVRTAYEIWIITSNKVISVPPSPPLCLLSKCCPEEECKTGHKNSCLANHNDPANLNICSWGIIHWRMLRLRTQAAPRMGCAIIGCAHIQVTFGLAEALNKL